MKRASIFVVPLVALLAIGCAVAFDDPETFEEDTTAHSQALDQVDVPVEETTSSTSEEPGSGPLEGQVSSGEGSGRPEPDPWMADQDPNRPDPDPWASEQSSTSNSATE